MGLARLDDQEYARRARERNNRVNAAHRQRLLEAGKAQTNIWLSAELRERLESEASAANVSLSTATEALLLDGLAYRRSLDTTPSLQTPLPSPVSVDTHPLFDTALDIRPGEPQRGPSDERLARILALKREQPQLSNYAIAAQIGCSEPTVRRVLKKQNQEAV